MRIVCISDTHTLHDDISVPDGDVLVHAGDFTRNGRPDQIAAFAQWLTKLPHKYKVVIPGNHDLLFEDVPLLARDIFEQNANDTVRLLNDSEVVIEGLKFYGSPWQPEFHGWAFNLPRGQQLANKWNQIPRDVDVLVTHGPPYGIMDKTYEGLMVGCEALTAILTANDGIKPKLHVFGHIHEGYGMEQIEDTLFVNASTCNLNYRPDNAPIVVTL